MDKAVLLLGHGSPVSEANKALWEIAEMVKERGGYNFVQPAFLQFEKPDLSEAIGLLVEKGIKEITVHPYFLYMGAHVGKDLPRELEGIKERHPGLELKVAPHLGVHTNLAEVAVEKIEEVINHDPKIRNDFSISSIEAESMRIVEERIDKSRFYSLEISIVKRAIHATADFDFGDTLIFHPGAVEAGCRAILDGKNIITDVRMVEVGINKKRLLKFGGKITSFIQYEPVVKGDITRSASAMRRARHCMDDNIVAIGNAPTALLELIRLVKEEDAKPALIIGLPVGFVSAKEAKEALEQINIPYITNRGYKGGSPVTAAVVNALLLISEESRGNKD